MFLLFGRTITESAGHRSTASRICAVDGFIDWPPATISCTPRLASRRRTPSPTADRDDRGRRPGPRAAARADPGERRGLVATQLLLLDLLEQVGDPDVARPAGLDAGLDGAADVVGVHVAVPEAVAADDHDRVAERGPRLLERVDGRVVGVEQVHHLVAQRRRCRSPCEVRLDGHRRGADGRLGDRAAVDHLEERVEQQREAAAAGVDDARLAEHRQQVGRVRDRVARRGRGARRAARRAPSLPRRRRASAASAAARTTVRIVPSTGRITAS